MHPSSRDDGAFVPIFEFVRSPPNWDPLMRRFFVQPCGLSPTSHVVQKLPLVVALLAGVASADPVVPDWNGTYKNDGGNGGGELCPHTEGAPLTIVNNAFSIDWKIHGPDNSLIHVGTLEGTVRPSGMTTVTAKLVEPMSRKLVAILEQMQDSPEKLRALAKDSHANFTYVDDSHRREMTLASSGDCTTTWLSTAKVSTKAVAITPTPAPALKVSPLPAGSSAWDQTYLRQGGLINDWRCPAAGDVREHTRVSKGRFSFPYQIQAWDGHGHSLGFVTLGQVDGSIAANGTVKLRTTLSIDALPPELTSGKADATLDSVREYMATGTMKFTRDTKNKKEMYAELEFGPQCIYYFQDLGTFVPGHSGTQETNGNRCKRDRDCESDNCDNSVCKE